MGPQLIPQSPIQIDFYIDNIQTSTSYSVNITQNLPFVNQSNMNFPAYACNETGSVCSLAPLLSDAQDAWSRCLQLSRLPVSVYPCASSGSSITLQDWIAQLPHLLLNVRVTDSVRCLSVRIFYVAFLCVSIVVLCAFRRHLHESESEIEESRHIFEEEDAEFGSY
jgi:hypothetical protein